MDKNNRYVDLSYLENMSGGSQELVKEMVEIFVAQIPEFILDMKNYLEKKDYQSLGLLAHKAKSSVAIMGMEELAQHLKDFELLAKDELDIEKYPLFIDKFEKDCNEAIEELQKIISET